MIGLENKTLRSERLAYRLLCETDKKALRTMLSDRSVAEPAGLLPPDSDAQTDVFFASLTEHNSGVAILVGETLVGYVDVDPLVRSLPEFCGKRGVNVGLVIDKRYHNHGYATEALLTMTAYLKQMFDDCIADHFEGNEPSRKVIEKCGYRYLETNIVRVEALGKEVPCLRYMY